MTSAALSTVCTATVARPATERPDSRIGTREIPIAPDAFRCDATLSWRDRIIESPSNRALYLGQQLGKDRGLIRRSRYRRQTRRDRGQPQRLQAFALIRVIWTIARIGQAAERGGQVDG